jgi:hypothetical protein
MTDPSRFGYSERIGLRHTAGHPDARFAREREWRNALPRSKTPRYQSASGNDLAPAPRKAPTVFLFVKALPFRWW